MNPLRLLPSPVAGRLRRGLAATTALVLAGSLAACSDDSKATDGVLRYTALGDSFSAGPWIPETVDWNCQRSDHNWPTLFAGEHEGVELEDRTCSGAKTVHVFQPQLAYGQQVDPQLDGVSASTDLVSISLSGNDFDTFGTIMGECTTLALEDPQGSPCTDKYTEQGKKVVDTIIGSVVDVVQAVQEKAPDAQVVLVGYPQFIPASGSCPDKLPLAAGDMAWARDVNEAMTQVVQQAAERTEVPYLDLWELTEGHDICSDDPWINGQTDTPGKATRYHPFLAFQEAVAQEFSEFAEGELDLF